MNWMHSVDLVCWAPWKREGLYWQCLSATRTFTEDQLRGRCKTSQKLAKRRAFVWGGGGLDRLRKASFKKNVLHVDYARCAPPGPAANRLELDRATSLIENSFSNIFGSFDISILTLLIISPSRLFLSFSAWFVIFHFFQQSAVS